MLDNAYFVHLVQSAYFVHLALSSLKKVEILRQGTQTLSYYRGMILRYPTPYNRGRFTSAGCGAVVLPGGERVEIIEIYSHTKGHRPMQNISSIMEGADLRPKRTSDHN